MKITCINEIDDIIILIDDVEHLIIPRGRFGLQAWKVNNKKFILEFESSVVENGIEQVYKNECHYDSFEKWSKVLKLIRENK